MSPASVSVVTICRDGIRDARRLVRSVQEQVVDVPVEIVVVDDGSDEPVADVLRDLGGPAEVHVVRREGDGNRAAARNAGAAVASGDLLVLVDADQEAPPGWLQDHVRWHRAAPGILLNGHRRHRSPADGTAWRPEVRERVTAVYSHNYARIAAAWYLQFSCNLSLPVDAYRALGGFDDDYRGWGLEDTDLGYRAHRAGLAIAHSTRAWTWDHHHVVRFDPDRVREWQRNRAVFLVKHPEPEAQAVRLVENYPQRTDVPRGHAWLDSFLAMDRHVRALREAVPLASPRTTLTVLDAADAEHARAEIARGSAVRVVDAVAGSGLDVEAFRAGSAVEYVPLGPQGDAWRS
ncbi:glycosyltransferase [Cellulosimicrobium sp. Marseille-Q4280]|uniref:glycosyltransferase family 2 protein n=1 Tax=Cellulosimicrobium sp. Marseille-Q4280 TaxID=2937992 RepID=UPI0020402CF8|nr:glycosyltransferase [Cellulosimicrobium sp. Marseille-Q4280]